MSPQTIPLSTISPVPPLPAQRNAPRIYTSDSDRKAGGASFAISLDPCAMPSPPSLMGKSYITIGKPGAQSGSLWPRGLCPFRTQSQALFVFNHRNVHVQRLIKCWLSSAGPAPMDNHLLTFPRNKPRSRSVPSTSHGKQRGGGKRVRKRNLVRLHTGRPPPTSSS